MNKFKFIFSYEDSIISLCNKVRKNLSSYLGFDIDEFLDEHSLVYGGAIRDSIADSPIADLDVLTSSKSRTDLVKKLQRHNIPRDPYEKTNQAGYGFLTSTYKNADKLKPIIVQLICDTTPRILKNSPILKSIDLTSCAIAYSKGHLLELHPEAINHCQNKQFDLIRTSVSMAPDRLLFRIEKFKSRGWKFLCSEKDLNDYLKKTRLTIPF